MIAKSSQCVRPAQQEVRDRLRAREIVMENLDASSAEEKAAYGVIKEKIRADLKRDIPRQT